MELDVSKKIRTAIKAKLLELGVHVDEELPDYIMILIANRRSKTQMDDDLSLFLGDNTLKFTAWLFQVLKKLQEVTTVVPPAGASKTATSGRKLSEDSPPVAKKTEEKQVPKEKSETADAVDSVSSEAPKRKHDVIEAPSVTTEKKAEPEEGTRSPVQKKIKVSRKPVETSEVTKEEPKPAKVASEVIKAEPPPAPRKVQSVVVSRKDSSSSLSEEKKTKEAPKLIRNRSPVTAPARSPPLSKHARSRSPVSHVRRDRSPTPPERKRRDLERPSRSPAAARRPTRKSRSRSPSPASRARRSLRSLVAVVKRHNELNAAKDEEYNPAHPEVTPTVASAVHVTPRPKRISKQEGSGSNKLLFRALADAQKSIVTHAIHSKVAASDNERSKIAEEAAESRKGDSKRDAEKRRDEHEKQEKPKPSSGRRVHKVELPTTSKPSIKDRLGFRLGNRVQSAPAYEEELPPYEDLEHEYEDELESEFLPTGQESYKSLIVKVPTSRDSKQRNVMLEDERKRPAITEEPRISIQVNVHSDDDSTSSEDELEIQPRASEDLNLEPKDAPRKSKAEDKSVEQVRALESLDENSKGSSLKSDVSKTEGPEVNKDVELADSGSKHSEEVEIEEYEEVEEDDDDDDYEVVIQEANFTLPDPEEYGASGADGTASSTENAQAMETAESRSREKLSATEYEMDESYVPEPPRYPLNSKSMNQRDSGAYAPKFVVTMDGAEDPYSEEMETETYQAHSSFDLRQRIGTRSVLAPRVPQYPPRFAFNPNARPFSAAPRPFAPSLVAPSSTAPVCKYWPDCSFKDKCIYPHPMCKYNEKCTKPDCPYKHDRVQTFGGSSTAEVKGAELGDGKILCKFFPKCHSMSCQFYHPSPCRFGLGCTDAKCKNFHPGQTVGQLRAKSKMFTAVGRGGYRAPPPAAHLLRWKAPAAASPAEAKKEEEQSTEVSPTPDVSAATVSA